MNVHEERNKKAEQLTQLLLSRRDFQEDVARLRKNWAITPGGFSDSEARKIWYDQYNSISNGVIDSDFKKYIVKLFIKSEKYKLTSEAWKPLLHYIVNGQANELFSGVLPKVTVQKQKRSNMPVYTMTFYEHTTEAEVRKVFGDFKTTNLKDKRQQLIPALKLKKMQRAKELRDTGMTWKEVASTVNKELKGSLEYNDARKLVEQYNKHLSK